MTYCINTCPKCGRDDQLIYASDYWQTRGFNSYCFNCDKPCNKEVVQADETHVVEEPIHDEDGSQAYAEYLERKAEEATWEDPYYQY